MYNIGEEEIKAIAGVIRSGKLFRYGEGDQCLTFEKRYADYLGAKYFRLTWQRFLRLARSHRWFGDRSGRRGHCSGSHVYGNGDFGSNCRRHSRRHRC